jgi:hypothetical protein
MPFSLAHTQRREHLDYGGRPMMPGTLTRRLGVVGGIDSGGDQVPPALDVLLPWPSSRVLKQIRKELERLFEGDLLELALAVIDAAAGAAAPAPAGDIRPAADTGWSGVPG